MKPYKILLGALIINILFVSAAFLLRVGPHSLVVLFTKQLLILPGYAIIVSAIGWLIAVVVNGALVYPKRRPLNYIIGQLVAGVVFYLLSLSIIFDWWHSRKDIVNHRVDGIMAGFDGDESEYRKGEMASYAFVNNFRHPEDFRFEDLVTEKSDTMVNGQRDSLYTFFFVYTLDEMRCFSKIVVWRNDVNVVIQKGDELRSPEFPKSILLKELRFNKAWNSAMDSLR